MKYLWNHFLNPDDVFTADPSVNGHEADVGNTDIDSDSDAELKLISMLHEHTNTIHTYTHANEYTRIALCLRRRKQWRVGTPSRRISMPACSLT